MQERDNTILYRIIGITVATADRLDSTAAIIHSASRATRSSRSRRTAATSRQPTPSICRIADPRL